LTFSAKKLPADVHPDAVFACNELDLSEVQVYGFDYDYTLACYKPILEDLLYNLAREMLVKRFRYPEDILDLEYEPNFAVRGLHYDVEKGLLVKLDSFLQLQLGSVYRGRTKVGAEEVLKLYHNRLLPIAYVEGPNNSYRVRILSPGSGLVLSITDLRSFSSYSPNSTTPTPKWCNWPIYFLYLKCACCAM